MEKSGLEDFDRDLVRAGWEWGCVDHGFSWSLAGEKEEVRRIGEDAIRGEVEGVKVVILYGSRTVGYFEETVEMIRDWWKEDQIEDGKKAIRAVEGTNHFGFVHKPREFVEVLMGCVEEST